MWQRQGILNDKGSSFRLKSVAQNRLCLSETFPVYVMVDLEWYFRGSGLVTAPVWALAGGIILVEVAMFLAAQYRLADMGFLS